MDSIEIFLTMYIIKPFIYGPYIYSEIKMTISDLIPPLQNRMVQLQNLSDKTA